MNKIVRILPGIFLSLLSLSSCDGLFTEDCIYKGYLHARNGFHHPSDMGTPEQAEMNLMVFPLTGNGVAEYDNLSIPFNGSGDAYGTLHIGSYEFLACNKDVNILEDAGSAATVRLRVPTEQGKITAEQGYAYSSSVTGTVMTDDTLHVTAPMRQYVRRLDIELTATEGDYSRVQSATATLSGVASAADMATGDRSVAAQVTNAFRQDDNKFTIFFRLLGIVPTETHTLTVDITFNNGDTQRVVSDLTEAIRDFNNGTKPVKLTGNLLLPVEAGVTGATITGWNEVESGNGDAN